MCGIAGRLNYRSDAPVASALIQAMCDLIAHRGPDGAGAWTNGRSGFGHRRLAILDLSRAVTSRCPRRIGPLTITFNGEIFNFHAVRARLVALGHTFQSESDTEVILAAWREWGPESLSELNGMFAFALWDAPRRTLLVARDRLGKKPLFYFHDERVLRVRAPSPRRCSGRRGAAPRSTHWRFTTT